MINILWVLFVLLGILFTKDFSSLNNIILYSGKKTLDLIINLFPVMAIWLGLMNIASKSGLLLKLSKFIEPLLHFIFPEIPKNSEAYGYISANLISNFFGLGSSSTPLGLKAMKELSEINKSDKTSRSMRTFLVLNTTGLTIIPTTIISLRLAHNSIDPSCITLACFFATLIGTIGGLIIDRIIP